MQQLTLQFDGYAPLGAAKAALPLKRIGECIFAAVSVVGGFALMFFAALIQG